jgi:pimeloyl-ACP methyl ester carboxylesterase
MHVEKFVLIRGLLRESRHWGKFPQHLQQQFPGADIITPDIPGNGSLSHKTSPASISSLTDALRTQLSYHKPINLIAISMGGMIAIDWMQRYPQEIKSVVIINTSLRNFSPCHRRLRWQAIPFLVRLLLQTSDAQERIIFQLTSNQAEPAPSLVKQWQCWRRENPVSWRSAFNQLLAAARFSSTQLPNRPTLIVTSLKDRLVDYRCSLSLHQAWQSEIRIHPSAGHDLPMDNPVWLTATIAQWLPDNQP